MKGSRRPRKDGYPLAGVLICDHCGKPMYGCHPTGRNYRVYRCSTPAKTGMGTCGMYEMREELILPQVLTMLAEEIGDNQKLLTAPPEELVAPGRKRTAQRDDRQEERNMLARKIEQAVENLMFATDARTRQAIDSKVNALRKELDSLDEQLEVTQEPDYRREELQALAEWWADFENRAVTMPVGHVKVPHAVATFYQDRFREDRAIKVDARVVNEALHSLGTQVRLRWRSKTITLPGGKHQNRHKFVGGRFRLGQQTGKVAGKNGVMFCKAGVGALCNDIRAAGRFDNRMGMD
jgi:hypothetical protein